MNLSNLWTASITSLACFSPSIKLKESWFKSDHLWFQVDRILPKHAKLGLSNSDVDYQLKKQSFSVSLHKIQLNLHWKCNSWTFDLAISWKVVIKCLASSSSTVLTEKKITLENKFNRKNVFLCKPRNLKIFNRGFASSFSFIRKDISEVIRSTENQKNISASIKQLDMRFTFKCCFNFIHDRRESWRCWKL